MILARFFCFVSVIELMVVSCDDAFFILKKYEDNQYFCVTNSSSAITWIDTDIKPEISVSSFFPKFYKTCISKYNESQLESWRCESSISNNIITDRRWEGFKVYQTHFDLNSKIKVETVAKKLEQNFSISLSIRIDQEAHVFFCDKPNGINSNCYWFILMGFNGTKTAVRKCAMSTPVLNLQFPSASCSAPENEVLTTKSGRFFSNNLWEHFYFKKIGKTIVLTDFNGKEIIRYHDKETGYTVNHMVILSKPDGFWKLHKLSYYRTEQPKVTIFEEFLFPVNKVICISTFLRMCQTCTIKFKFRNLKDIYQVLKETEFTSTTSDWREIKFHVSDVESSAILIITTLKPAWEKNPFWELDDIKQCSFEGYRIIKTSKAANCQLLSNKGKVLSFSENLSPALQQHPDKCSEDTVSMSCVPCSLLFNTTQCGQLKVCERNGTLQNCYCGAGFQKNNENECIDECTDDSYGYQCQHKCSRQCVNCNKATGKCTSCKNGYSGFRCLIPQSFSQNPPRILKSTYTNAKIYIPELKTNSNGDESPSECSFQYKVANKSSIMWTYVEKYNCIIGKNITMKDLGPGKRYLARVTFFFKNRGQDFFDFDFITKCDVAKPDKFQTESSHTFIEFSPTNNSRNRMCPFHSAAVKVEIQPSDGLYDYYFYNSSSFRVSGLQPSRVYFVRLHNRTSDSEIFALKVQTAEIVPEKIANIELTEKSSTKISLKWKPSNQNQYEWYIILYEEQFHLGCDFNNPKNSAHKQNQQLTNHTFITLTHLIPYTNYKISVAAKNKKFQGPFTVVNFNTSEAENVPLDEIPHLVSKTEQSRSIDFKFLFDCSKIRRSSLIKISANCLDPWCKNSTQTYEYNPKTKTTFKNLEPYTNYIFNFEVCRNRNCRLFRRESVTTKPEPAYVVQNLLIYTKNESSISVRWKPPYPPTGVVELYLLVIQSKGLPDIKKNVTNSTCNLWSNFQCFTINNLEKNKKYDISIQAKNRNVGMGQNIATKNVLTKIEPSEPPTDVKLRWTLKNDLIISWRHPVVANGDILSFNVSVVPQNEKNEDTNIYKLSSRYEYKSIYHYKISRTKFLPSKIYRINVSAYNGLKGNETYVVDSSPPEIPKFIAEPKIDFSNETIGIETSNVKDFQTSHNYKLFLFLVDEKLNNIFNEAELVQFEGSFNIKLSNLKLFYKCNQYENSTKFIVREPEESPSTCEKFANISLIPGKKYSITILLVHKDANNKTSYNLYTEVKFEVPANGTLLPLLLFLLVIPIVFNVFLIYYARKKDKKTEKTHKEEKQELISITRFSTSFNAENEHNSKLSPADFIRNFPNMIQHKTLERQYQHIIEAFQNIYEDLKKTLDYHCLNLSYENGSQISKAYVVCTASKPEELDLFWNLVWEENVENIVFLDNFRFQNHYWPTLHSHSVCKKFSLQCICEEHFSNYEFRTLTLTVKGKVRVINHFRFINWSDVDLPDQLSCLHFFKKIAHLPLNSESPILFHSRSSLKSTGFALLCDMSLRIAEKDKVVDVFKTAHALANSSLKLVDNYECYELAHFVILECLLSSDVDIDVNLDSKGLNHSLLFKEEKLHKYLSYMKNTMFIDEIVKVSRESYAYFRVEEPHYLGEVLLKPYYPDQEMNSKLAEFEGIVIPHANSEKFVLIKQPSSENLKQFWDLLIEMKVSEIVLLNEIENSEDYFWTETKKAVKLGNITLENTLITNFHCYDQKSIKVSCDGKEKKRKIQIFALKNWFSHCPCPPDITTFANFCLETYCKIKNSNPLLVICRDGVTASSLYLAMLYNIQKIEKENQWDICVSSRMIRKYCKDFGKNEEQLRFFWKATENCMQQQNLYEVF